MRGVVAVCTVALLAATLGGAQQCVHKTRVAGERNLNSPIRKSGARNAGAVENQLDAVEANVECITTGVNCDDEAATATSCDDDDECDCVPFYLCASNTETENRVRLLDIQMNDTAECTDSLEVCCGKACQIFPNPDGRGPNGGKPLQFKPTPVLSCGQRNSDGVGFRIAGNVDDEAQFGEFPWMVALIEIVKGEEVFLGGGSLIHEKVVLTAAHRVVRFKRNPSNLRIRAGEWDTRSTSEILPHQQLTVQEVIVHERFNSGSLHNNIALLVLHDQLDQADNVGTLCLPEQGAVVTSTECIATGWGKDVFGNAGCYRVVLKSILLPMVQPQTCETLMRRTRLGRKFVLDTSFTCAGGEAGKSTCTGDGGGPLACPIPGDEDYYEQAGIVSWGVGCGAEEVPGVYTNVALFRHWVDDKFAERGFETAAYTRP